MNAVANKKRSDGADGHGRAARADGGGVPSPPGIQATGPPPRAAPPSSITSVIARSRKVRRSGTNAATSSGSSASGQPPRLAHQPPRRCVTGPGRYAPAGHGGLVAAQSTAFSARAPVITANSNKPRTAAIRRFMMAGIARVPRRAVPHLVLAGKRDLRDRGHIHALS